ncbi:50S ribosomal protein L10 [Candidatus Kaiserbacteria bacterium]|nr:50S ribosomal protein L10 [Candidatus Kaiserbacteria bacterium]
MAVTKAKKREIAAKLGDILSRASSLVFVRFNKLAVADAARVRRALKGESIGYVVAKKTLLRRALAEKGYIGELPDLPGEIALAWTTEGDATAPARGVYEHAKKLKGALVLVGGVFDNAYRDLASITAIAVIPPLPVLRGMFVNIINSPIQGLVVALSQVAEIKK